MVAVMADVNAVFRHLVCVVSAAESLALNAR